MKNIFLSAALVLTLTVNATSLDSAYCFTKEVAQEKEYKKIEATAIPSTISKEIKDKYEGYTIAEAYSAADGSDYKLVVSKDTNALTVWYTAAGEFIKEEKKAN